MYFDASPTHAATQLVTPPAIEPVTLDEAKVQCRVEHTDEDALITGLIVAARDYAEKAIAQAFIAQTWKLVIDQFPLNAVWYLGVPHFGRRQPETRYPWIDGNAFRLPRPPLLTLTSIAYVDNLGLTQTMDPSAYQVDAVSRPARVVPAYGKSWPSTRYQMNAVTVTYQAGYGSLASDVPQPIKQAILMLVAHWYLYREPAQSGTPGTIPWAVDALLMSQWHGTY